MSVGKSGLEKKVGDPVAPKEYIVGSAVTDAGCCGAEQVGVGTPEGTLELGGGHGNWGMGTHLSTGEGAPGHRERSIQLGRVIVLQRRVQFIPGGPGAGGRSTGTRGRGRRRSGGSDFRVGSPGGGVRGGHRFLLLLQLPESAEGHGSGARRPSEEALAPCSGNASDLGLPARRAAGRFPL